MPWDGKDRRLAACKAPCEKVILLELTVNGNGKPGLLEDVHLLMRGMYGDEQNQIPGVISRQIEIWKILKPIKQVLTPWVLYPLCVMSFLACAKILGLEWLIETARHIWK